MFLGQEKHIIETWEKAEKLFQNNGYNGNPIRKLSIRRAGKGPVLFVSVHATNHYSGKEDADIKVADLYTGGMARTIAYCTQSPLIFNTSRNSEHNPHLGEMKADSVIRKQILSGSLKAVLDIHGCKDNNDFDIAIGTGGSSLLPNQQKLLDILYSVFNKTDFKIALNPPDYAGMRPTTLVHRHRLDSAEVGILQLEFSRSLRRSENPQAIATIKALNKFVGIVQDA